LDFDNDSRKRVRRMENMFELIFKSDGSGGMEMEIYSRKIPHEKTGRLPLDLSTIVSLLLFLENR